MEIEVGDEITCTLCGSFLSVPPIIDVEDIGIVCGRCQDIIYVNKSNPKIDRQSLYEKMATSKRFPCMYHLLGCTEKPTWGDVVDHEKSCSFGIIACFYRPKEDSEQICEWNGDKEHLISHFEDSHPEYFVTQPKVSVKEIFTKKYCMLLTEYSKTLILFFFIFDEESDSICVMAATDRNQKAMSLQYELKMSDEEKKSMSFSEYSVLNCLYIGADVKKFGYKIKMSLFQQFPEFHNISIKMGSRKIESIVELSYVSSFSKCKRCKRSMIPPALFFFDMRSKKQVRLCSDCLAKWPRRINDNHETYNFMSLYNKFLCENSSNGCNHIYSYSAAKTHQNICPLNIIECALCEWQGRRDSLNTHVNEKHVISDIHDRYDLRTSTKLFKFDDQFLSCSVSKTLTDCCFFEFIVNSEQSANCGYKYEIEIFSEKLIPTQLIFQHIADKKLFKILKENEKCRTISVPLDLLEQLFPIIPGLKFKLNVSKFGMD